MTLLAGIRAKVANRRGSVKVAHAKGCEAVGGARDGFEEAARIARDSDVAILPVGEPSTRSSEGGLATTFDTVGH